MQYTVILVNSGTKVLSLLAANPFTYLFSFYFFRFKCRRGFFLIRQTTVKQRITREWNLQTIFNGQSISRKHLHCLPSEGRWVQTSQGNRTYGDRRCKGVVSWIAILNASHGSSLRTFFNRIKRRKLISCEKPMRLYMIYFSVCN